MRFKLIILFIVFQLSKLGYSQNSLTNPLICHDNDKYLRCFNDGDYILKFEKGNFKGFITSDNSLSYSENYKTITFINKKWIDSKLFIDSIQIQLLSKSIILKKGTSLLHITSLDKLPKEISEYGVGYYSINNKVEGLSFWANDKYIELNMVTLGRDWSWIIKAKSNEKRFVITYNWLKDNRVEYIFIEDDRVRHGMTISMTLTNLNKVRSLKASYLDTLSTLKNGIPVIGYIQLDNYYKYEYGRNGKLKIKGIIGELKLCDCN